MDEDNQKDLIENSNESANEVRPDAGLPAEEHTDNSTQQNRDWSYDTVCPPPVKSQQSNLALASLIMGIMGIVTSCCCYGGLIFGSLGILFALLSRTEDRFEGYAKAGLITSAIALGLTVLAGIIYVCFMIVNDIHAGGVF